jgi:predicted  nucleic acid-binding Zn-ribbon protein
MAKRSVSPIDLASDRLAHSFARLEHAVQQRKHIVAANPQDMEALNESWGQHCEALEADLVSVRNENEALRGENTHLSNQLQQLQQEYLELRKLTESVAAKLDKKAEQLELLA